MYDKIISKLVHCDLLLLREISPCNGTNSLVKFLRDDWCIIVIKWIHGEL